MAWVIKRTDQKGGYVTRPGSAKSYSQKLQDARQFPTKEAAERQRCPGNEVAVEFDKESMFNALALGQRTWEER